MAIFSGGKDVLADPTDVQTLYDELKSNGANIVSWTKVPAYAHSDFLRDIDTYQMVYQYIIPILNKYA